MENLMVFCYFWTSFGLKIVKKIFRIIGSSLQTGHMKLLVQSRQSVCLSVYHSVYQYWTVWSEGLKLGEKVTFTISFEQWGIYFGECALDIKFFEITHLYFTSFEFALSIFLIPSKYSNMWMKLQYIISDVIYRT